MGTPKSHFAPVSLSLPIINLQKRQTYSHSVLEYKYKYSDKRGSTASTPVPQVQPLSRNEFLLSLVHPVIAFNTLNRFL